MSRNFFLAALALKVAASAQAANTVSFNGVSLEGLTTVTDSSALNGFGANKAAAIASVTDANWQVDGINSMNGGSFVGEFGQTFTSAGNYLYIISPGVLAGNDHSTHIGSFTASLLLANNQLVAAGSYSDLSYTATNFLVSGNYYSAGIFSPNPGEAVAQYIRIDLSQYDTQGVGVKGIKFDNFTNPYLDLNYVGITGAGTPVPEPSTYGLALGGLALVGAVTRRRKISN